MKFPVEAFTVLMGSANGALALAIVGFTWGGWTTDGQAEASARSRADAAVVAALAPMCVDRFQRAADARANLAALRRVYEWKQGEFVAKGGWASLPGIESPEQVSAVASACAALLTR